MASVVTWSSKSILIGRFVDHINFVIEITQALDIIFHTKRNFSEENLNFMYFC